MTQPPTVLFVCHHNANRWQIAAGYLEAVAGDRIRALKVSLVVLLATAVAQAAVAVVSGSVALLAGTVPNFADAGTAVPLWIAFALGRRPATRRYTYGYGRPEDLAGLFILVMITPPRWLPGTRRCTGC